MTKPSSTLKGYSFNMAILLSLASGVKGDSSSCEGSGTAVGSNRVGITLNAFDSTYLINCVPSSKQQQPRLSDASLIQITKFIVSGPIILYLQIEVL